MTIDIRTKALNVVTAAANGQLFPTGHSLARVNATRDVRVATCSGLKEALNAVDWAIGQHNMLVTAETTNTVDLDKFRVPTTHGWRYEFSNGHSASVINDPHRPFRFEVLSDDPADAARGRVAPGLTSEEVEAKLHLIAALPAR